MGLNAKRPSTTRSKEMEKARADLLNEDAPKTTRLNVEITVPQHRALKARAAEEGRSVKDIVSTLIGDYLNK